MEPRDLLQSLAQPGSADLPVSADWGPIQALIATWIPAGISLHQPVVESATPEAVTLTGTLTTAATGGLAWPAGGNARVELALLPATQNAPETLAGTLYLQAPTGWLFSNAFPGLPKTADLRDLANPTQTPLLDGLGLSKTWLVFTTQGIDRSLTLAGQDYGAVQLPRGLGVVSRLTTAGVVGVLTVLAPEITLAGSIVPAGAETGLTIPPGQFPWDLPTTPGIHLTGRFTPDLVLGTGLQTTVSFRLYTPLSQTWLDANPGFDPLMAMEGDLTLEQAAITARLVATRMLGQSDRVEWLASFKAGTHEGINVDDLAALIGDGHQAGFLKTYLPESVANALTAVSPVSLKGLSIELATNANGGHRVVNTGIYLGLDTGKVTLIDGVLSLDAVEVVEIIVRDPFGSDLALSDRVMGTLVFDATFLDAAILGMLSLPGFSIELQLAEEKAIPIDALFTERGLDPNLKPAALVIEDFFIRANLEGDFGIGAHMAEAPAWTIDLGVTSIALAEVGFTANRYSWGDKNASFSALLKLGDPAGETVDITVSAAVRTGAGSGWRFQGGLQPGSTITVGAFVDKLAHHFGDVTTPASVANLVVDAFSVDFDTGAKSFSGAMAVTFPLNGEERHVRLGIDITHRTSDGGYDKTFTLTLGGLRFVLLDKQDLVLATYEGDATLKPRDLAASLSPALAADIPDGIELTIKEAFFFHRTDPADPANPVKKTGRSLFGIHLGARFDLSALPILGQALPGDTLAVDQLRFLLASAAFTADEVRALNLLLPAGGVIPLPAAPGSLPSGPSVAAQLNWGGQTKPLFLDARPPVAPGQSPANSPANNPAPAPLATSDGATWFTIDRTFGPLHISRVGAQFKDNVLRFLVDGELGAAGFTLSLLGLEVGSPIAVFSPQFDLQGLGLSVDAENP